ncbi:MAG: hypothetical protein V4440_08705 [Pseudomonadota bacterium]
MDKYTVLHALLVGLVLLSFIQMVWTIARIRADIIRRNSVLQKPIITEENMQNLPELKTLIESGALLTKAEQLELIDKLIKSEDLVRVDIKQMLADYESDDYSHFEFPHPVFLLAQENDFLRNTVTNILDGVPAGYGLFPLEPTPQMFADIELEVAQYNQNSCQPDITDPGSVYAYKLELVRIIYKAMVNKKIPDTPGVTDGTDF